jgi:hypothetical protein
MGYMSAYIRGKLQGGKKGGKGDGQVQKPIVHYVRMQTIDSSPHACVCKGDRLANAMFPRTTSVEHRIGKPTATTHILTNLAVDTVCGW